MKRGFSLIEVIVSTVLLGVLGTIVVMFFVSSAQPLRQSQHREFAHVIARSELLNSTQLAVGDHPVDDVLSDGVVYHTVIRVTDIAGYSATEIRQVSVNVTWSEKGKTHVVQRQRLVSDAEF